MNNVKPLFWHKECLSNWERSIEEKQRSIDQEIALLELSRKELKLYRKQIDRAEIEGREGFDREKYGKKRAKP